MAVRRHVRRHAVRGTARRCQCGMLGPLSEFPEMTIAKPLTSAQRKHGKRLWRALDAAHTAVYQGTMNTPFNEALAIAPKPLAEAYATALSAVSDFEHELASQGRGYFNRNGHFVETGTVTSPWL